VIAVINSGNGSLCRSWTEELEAGEGSCVVTDRVVDRVTELYDATGFDWVGLRPHKLNDHAGLVAGCRLSKNDSGVLGLAAASTRMFIVSVKVSTGRPRNKFFWVVPRLVLKRGLLGYLLRDKRGT